MDCEVLRVLQLSDTAIVPISFHVPRKVRVAWVRGWKGLGIHALPASCLSVIRLWNSMKTCFQTPQAACLPLNPMPGGLGATSR